MICELGNTRGPVLILTGSRVCIVSSIVCAGRITLLIIKSPVRSDRNYKNSQATISQIRISLSNKCWFSMLALLTVITLRLTTCKQIRKFLTGDDGTLFWSRSLWSVFSVDVTGSLCIILRACLLCIHFPLITGHRVSTPPSLPRLSSAPQPLDQAPV